MWNHPNLALETIPSQSKDRTGTMRIIESFKGPKAMDTSRIIKQKARIPSIGRSLAKRFWFLGVTVFCLLNANFSYSQIPQSERDVLISIYNATNGDGPMFIRVEHLKRLIPTQQGC